MPCLNPTRSSVQSGRVYCIPICRVSYGNRSLTQFECELDDRRFVDLRAKISEEIDPEADRVCYYTLCAACKKRIEGISDHEHPIPKREDYAIV